MSARVTAGEKTTTSSPFGAFTIPDVTVPAGQSSLITTAEAHATIGGVDWSGQNTVEVLSSSRNTSNVQIVLSNTAQQGVIAGVVQDSNGRPLAFARVFASAPDPAGGAFFTNLGSFVAITNRNGEYTLPRLPPLNGYTVSASFAGQINKVAKVAVTAGQSTSVSFRLDPPRGNSTVPVVTGFSAIALTLPNSGGRGASGGAAGIAALKHLVYERSGLLRHRLPDPTRIQLRRPVTRNSPQGSIVETDLFWDYASLDNLLGYDILRSDNVDGKYRSIALMRDALADRFSDVDDLLTVDLTYYYSVARLDTINFPVNGSEGPPKDPPVVVRPLAPLALSTPTNGSDVAGAPAFSWSAVNRAAKYQVLLYDRFPNYQSDTDPNGVRPVWPPNQNSGNPGLIQAPGLSIRYTGPALQAGRTYYWAVLAADDVNSAYSISPIQSFVAR